MKLFLMLVGMAAAGVLGYMTEPSFRPQLTGIPAGGSSKAGKPGAAATGDMTASDIDLASLTREQLPEKIILNEEVRFADESSGLTITVAAGSRAKLIRIDGKNVAVRPGDTAYTVVLPISKTDLMTQLAANPPSAVPPAPTPAGDSAEPPPTQEPAVTPAPAQETTPAQEATPAQPPPPIPTPEATPAPASETSPASDTSAPPPTETAPAPDATPTPAPEPAAAPAAQPAPVTETAPPASAPATPVRAMQESIRAGQIKEFTFQQVLDWKPGTAETVDGESFQTGVVSYKAETIFGVKTIQAKALIKDGKVLRWIWPKSGMEIK